MKKSFEKPRLCWTRRELIAATGVSYRTLQNLELRGLLVRVMVGVNLVLHTDASVQALFGDNAAQAKEAA